MSSKVVWNWRSSMDVRAATALDSSKANAAFTAVAWGHRSHKVGDIP
ncbi:MAG: hypothetical protein JOZ78_03330 [Chroococcidiopsidaceae cyanobacterium CP_BM_ER_R8_30]|nr:hypothetical protein [Chroococcidiopsidaceae cyanobacterium CP_BM_ER_R8_30]